MNTDYLIIGGGTAGCVLARRLLDKLDCRVTVLEAGGPDDEPAIHRTDLASVVSMVDDPELARRYETAPQPGLGGRSVTIAQARVLGGGSSINATMYVRGDRHDFDHWRELGNDGWGYRDVLPYFATAEHYAGGGDPVYRGSDGPLHVTPYHQPSAASLAFLDAASELGYGQPATDYNAGRLAGTACLYQSTRTKDDRRCSTAVAYLHPVLPDPRLSVHVGAVATRILLRDGRATGAEFIRDGQVTQVYADREVIVASGALASPKLLMLSGIGPAEALREHGIVPAVDLPGVGRNLHDHLLYGVAYQSRRPLPPPRLLAEAGLFTHSRTGAEGEPDLQFFFGPVFYAAERYRVAGPAFTAAQPRHGLAPLGGPGRPAGRRPGLP